jgi:hypothetical protein
MAVFYVKRRCWKIFFSSLVFLAFISIPFLSLAIEPADIPGNIHVGQLEIHPSLILKEEYNDNIYELSNHETGSFITTYSPGIAFQVPFQRHLLNMDYRADIIEPSRHQNYQTENHFANIILDLDFNRLNIQIGDNWARDSVEPDAEEDVRNDYNQNRFFLDTSYKLANRYKIKGFFRNENREFNTFHKSWHDPELDNYMKNEVGFNLFYRFLPLTSALFEYGYTHISNLDKGNPSTDSNTNRVWLGLTWEATSKITGTIKGGYVYRDYHGDIDDFSNFGMKADLNYELTSYTTIALNGFRKPVDTCVTEEEGIYGPYYVSTGGTLSLDHKLTHKISANAHVSYRNDDYEEKGIYGKKRRDDDCIGLGVGVNYQVQDWLGCEVSYSYVDNDSNVEIEDYRTNIIAGKISLTF